MLPAEVENERVHCPLLRDGLLTVPLALILAGCDCGSCKANAKPRPELIQEQGESGIIRQSKDSNNLMFYRDLKRGVICYRVMDHDGMFCFIESKLNQGETK